MACDEVICWRTVNVSQILNVYRWTQDITAEGIPIVQNLRQHKNECYGGFRINRNADCQTEGIMERDPSGYDNVKKTKKQKKLGLKK